MKKEFALEKTYDVTATIQIVKRTNGKYYAEIKRNFDDLWKENDEYECWIEDDGQLMTEPVSTEKEYDAIIETFCSYIQANGIKYARICDKCGNGMNEGYVVEGGKEYYCTPKCLHEVYTPMEWQNRFSDECTENYWTEWDNIGSEYFLFNNKLINI
jgi:hypothetical protein